MFQVAIWILSWIVIIAFVGAGLALLFWILKFLLSLPYLLYRGWNEDRLGPTPDVKLFNGKEILNFYARAITFRRPLIP